METPGQYGKYVLETQLIKETPERRPRRGVLVVNFDYLNFDYPNPYRNVPNVSWVKAKKYTAVLTKILDVTL